VVVRDYHFGSGHGQWLAGLDDVSVFWLIAFGLEFVDAAKKAPRSTPKAQTINKTFLFHTFHSLLF
jgi:hypothetical protein